MSDAIGAVGQFGQQYLSGPQGAYQAAMPFAPLIGLATQIPQMMEQYKLRQQLQNPAKLLGKINPQVQENIRQNVEGSLGSSLGSGAPALVARGVADADTGYQLQTLQTYIDSLKQAGGMFPGAGSLAEMLALATGGLGGQYSANPYSGTTTPMGDIYGTGGMDPAMAKIFGGMQQGGSFSGA